MRAKIHQVQMVETSEMAAALYGMGQEVQTSHAISAKVIQSVSCRHSPHPSDRAGLLGSK